MAMYLEMSEETQARTDLAVAQNLLHKYGSLIITRRGRLNDLIAFAPDTDRYHEFREITRAAIESRSDVLNGGR